MAGRSRTTRQRLMKEGKGPNADFVLNELRQIVGAQHVTTDHERLEVNSRDIGSWHTLGAVIVQPGPNGSLAPGRYGMNGVQ
jgi:hypothetical protein